MQEHIHIQEIITSLCLTELVFCILFDLMCGQSVRCQLVFGKFAEAAYCFAMLDFEHYSLTKAKVLCQMF